MREKESSDRNEIVFRSVSLSCRERERDKERERAARKLNRARSPHHTDTKNSPTVDGRGQYHAKQSIDT